MRQKRTKANRRLMALYSNSFGFREPYQVLVDDAFCQTCVEQKLEVVPRLEGVLQGKVKPMITQCCMQHLYDLGPSGQAAVELARSFERRKCNHWEAKEKAKDCISGILGEENRNRYVVATQAGSLRTALRKVPGTPILYLNRSILLLEPPSEASMEKKKQIETSKLLPSAEELAFLQSSSLPSTSTSSTIIGASKTSMGSLPHAQASTSASTIEQTLRKKKKGPKGPNPLSIKKKKPLQATGGEGKGKEKAKDGVTGKRKRGDGDGKSGGEGRGLDEEGGMKKRKRKRKAHSTAAGTTAGATGATTSVEDTGQ